MGSAVPSLAALHQPNSASDPDISMRVSCAKLFATQLVGRVPTGV